MASKTKGKPAKSQPPRGLRERRDGRQVVCLAAYVRAELALQARI